MTRRLRSIAANPVVDNIGLTDPHGFVHGDRVYLFATHDFSSANKAFVMTDWWVWSSDYLVTWRKESVLDPRDTYLRRPFNDCWATFGVERGGRWYWYLSTGPTEIGVVTADSPAGPWRDPIGKPLIAKDLVKTDARDPDVFLDDDGEAYLVFGTWNYFLVRLGRDMVSLAEAPRPLHIEGAAGPYGAGRTDDKPSLHKRGGVYYLSWSSFYAMSDKPYGPYTFRGTVIAEDRVAPEFCTEALRHDRHGNFFAFRNQWFYVFNDKSQPGRGQYYRDSCLSYLHYRDNGEMAPIRLDRIGVGTYDGAARIEAEDFTAAVGAEVRELPPAGFQVAGFKPGAHLLYPKVQNLPAGARLTVRAACAYPAGAAIDIRAGGPTGAVLGTCRISGTGGRDQFVEASCYLANPAGTQDLCLTPVATSAPVDLDWLICSPASRP